MLNTNVCGSKSAISVILSITKSSHQSQLAQLVVMVVE